MNVKPSSTDFIRGGNYTSGTGAFTYWRGSFKSAIDASKRGDSGSPFENVRVDGVRYEDTSNFGDDQRAKLIDSDSPFGGSSSYITLTLKPGWQALFYVKTENNDFFEDYVNADYETGDWNNSDPFMEELREATDQLTDAGYPSIWIQDNAEASDSRAIFTLDGDRADYMSFDIDSRSSNVGQARIRIDGTQYIQNEEIDNETFITMIWLRQWIPDAVLASRQDDNEVSGPLEEGGSGDLDGDGVIDRDDVDPYDPDVQEEGDVDYDQEGMVIGEVCPPGFKDNGSGVCIPIEDNQEDQELDR